MTKINGWKLIRNSDGTAVAVGDTLKTFRGDEFVVTGWAPSRGEGHVHFEGGRYYTGVFNTHLEYVGKEKFGRAK